MSLKGNACTDSKLAVIVGNQLVWRLAQNVVFRHSFDIFPGGCLDLDSNRCQKLKVF